MNDEEKDAQKRMNRWLKIIIYQKIIKELDACFGEPTALDDAMKMASMNAKLKDNLPYMFFVGFYRVDESRQGKEKLLKIVSYQGKFTELLEIVYSEAFARGVCGQCALQERTINVPDVSEFYGYYACDPWTKSEIVVPVFQQGKLIAVLDIGSDNLNSFDNIDEFFLRYLVERYFSAYESSRYYNNKGFKE